MFDGVLDNTHFWKSSICSFMLTAASVNRCVTHEYTDLVIGHILKYDGTPKNRMAVYFKIVLSIETKHEFHYGSEKYTVL
jgi:hypothetical protein